MLTAKQRITPKKKRTTKKRSTATQDGKPIVTVDVQPPRVSVEAPQVNIPAPEINLRELENTVKNIMQRQAEFAETMANMIKEQNARIDKIMNENSRILETIAKRKPMARPNDFYVEFDKDGGDTVGMRIRGRKTN